MTNPIQIVTERAAIAMQRETLTAATTAPITVAAARKALAAEGHTADNIETALNSLYNAGLDIPAARQHAVAYRAPGGIAAVVVTWGPLGWTAPGTGLPGDAETLEDAVREMSLGEWLPNDGDGWFVLDGEFDPETHAGWEWTKVAEAEAYSIDQMLLTATDRMVLREQLALWV
jgi:hypothetical protein